LKRNLNESEATVSKGDEGRKQHIKKAEPFEEAVKVKQAHCSITIGFFSESNALILDPSEDHHLKGWLPQEN
jgi:hypothetical protein